MANKVLSILSFALLASTPANASNSACEHTLKTNGVISMDLKGALKTVDAFSNQNLRQLPGSKNASGEYYSICSLDEADQILLLPTFVRFFEELRKVRTYFNDESGIGLKVRILGLNSLAGVFYLDTQLNQGNLMISAPEMAFEPTIVRHELGHFGWNIWFRKISGELALRFTELPSRQKNQESVFFDHTMGPIREPLADAYALEENPQASFRRTLSYFTRSPSPNLLTVGGEIALAIRYYQNLDPEMLKSIDLDHESSKKNGELGNQDSYMIGMTFLGALYLAAEPERKSKIFRDWLAFAKNAALDLRYYKSPSNGGAAYLSLNAVAEAFLDQSLSVTEKSKVLARLKAFDTGLVALTNVDTAMNPLHDDKPLLIKVGTNL